MTKVDELIDSIYNKEERFDYTDIEKIMKEYAEYYAKQCLAIAAEKALFSVSNSQNKKIWLYGNRMSVPIVNRIDEIHIFKESITNIKLPEHDKPI